MVIQWFPGHMAKATREVKEKLKLVDIVFELVDARCPLSSHNMYLDEVVKDKKKIIIFNKIDLCDRTETAKWKNYFEKKGYTVVYTDAKNSNNLNKVIDKAKEELAEKIARQVAKGIKPRAIRSMVIGVPNVGKSTFINKLIKKNVANTANLYKIDVTADDENVFIMEKIADKRFKKIGGDYDYDSTIKLLIQDFRTQKFGLITLDNYNDMINEEVSDEN